MTDAQYIKILELIIREARKALVFLLTRYDRGDSPKLKHAIEICEIMEDV